MKATKDQILAGRAPEPYFVPALDAEVVIRRLRSTEAQEVQAAEMAGLKAGAKMPRRGIRPAGHLGKGGIARDAEGEPDTEVSPDIAIDLGAIVTGTHRSNQLAMHYGLVEPAMSLTEVQATDAETVEQIGEEVKRRTGIADAAAIRTFRGEPGGPDDTGDHAGGGAAGANDR